MNDKGDIHDLVEPRHHRAEIVFGGLAFAAALFLTSQAGSEVTWDASRGIVNQPGFWPVMAIAGMTLCGALELYASWRRNATGRGDSISGEVLRWILSVEYALWFMAYVLAVPVAGYLASTLAFCVLLTWRLGYRSPRMFGAAGLVGLVTVVVFKGLLSVKMPGGAVYEYLPAAWRNVMTLYF